METDFQPFIDYDNFMVQLGKKVDRHNHRLLNLILKIKGRAFVKGILQCLAESSCSLVPFSIVHSVEHGEWQEESHGPIKGIWVHQYVNGGYTGDNFEGYIYIQIKENRFLKCQYSM